MAVAGWKAKAQILLVTIYPQAVVSMLAMTPPIMANEIAASLGLSPEIAGFYVGLVYVGAIASSSFTASLITSCGPLRTSFVCVIAGGVGLALFALFNVIAALVATVLIGLAYGPLTPASSHVLARYRTQGGMNFLVSVRQTSVPIGGVLAGLVAPPLVVGHGWANACALIGLATAASGALLGVALKIVRNEPPDAPHGHSASMLEPARFILRRPGLTRLALSSMIYAAMQLVLSSFLVVYLTGATGLDLVRAGALLSASQLAGVGGRLFWGYVADRASSPRAVLLVIAVLMALAAALMSLFSPAWPILGLAGVVVLLGGTASGWNGVFLAEIMRDVGAAEVGLATSGSLMFTYLGIVFGPSLFGAAASLIGFPGAYIGMGAAVLVAGAAAAMKPRAK